MERRYVLGTIYMVNLYIYGIYTSYVEFICGLERRKI